MFAVGQKVLIRGMGEAVVLEAPDDDEGSVLVESVLVGTRAWIDEWRCTLLDESPVELVEVEYGRTHLSLGTRKFVTYDEALKFQASYESHDGRWAVIR